MLSQGALREPVWGLALVLLVFRIFGHCGLNRLSRSTERGRSLVLSPLLVAGSLGAHLAVLPVVVLSFGIGPQTLEDAL